MGLVLNGLLPMEPWLRAGGIAFGAGWLLIAATARAGPPVIEIPPPTPVSGKT